MSATVSWRRRGRVQVPDNPAGTVETCVLRMGRRRRLDQGEQGGGCGIDSRQRNKFASPHRKYVLVRMERENRLAGLRYFADACISIGEGIGEGAAERVDRVVQRKLSRDLAAVHQ